MSKTAATISIILAAVLGFFVGNIAATPSGSPTVTQDTAAGTGPRQNDSDRIPVGNSPSMGPANALVTIVEFSDFECPFCGRVEDTMRQLRQRYGNDVRIVWKNNPLPFHQNATPAAEAAMAAFAQRGNDGFWRMHDLLFQNQRALTRPDLERYAQQIGLDMARFRRDMDTHAHQASIDADKALAQRLNAQGTPNFFVNGTNIVGAQPLERFTALVDAVLERARTIQPRDRVYAQMVANPIPAPGEENRPNQPQQPQQPQQRPAEPDPSTVYNVPVGNSPVQGAADALVTMVVFSEFQCPFCQRVQDTMRQLRERYGRDLRIVWKNEPLDFHPNAMPAAEAAMAAHAQGKFWEMHDLLFQNQREQGGLERPAFERYAQQLGLNMDRFRRELDQHTHQAAIRADMDLAQRIGANGTPHFFINGKRLVGAQPLERFTAAIDEARTAAQALVTQGTPRAQVYQRLTGNGANTVVMLPAQGGNDQGQQPGQQPGQERIYNVADAPNNPFRGGRNARVVIHHFSDYQCPFCTRVNPTLDQIAQTYGDRVRIVWRDFPLEFHQNAMPAAEAAREAFAQQGNAGFWRFHDTLFQNQNALTRQDLERYAQAQGLDMARFRAALDNHTHQAAIRADMQAAQATGAEMGTPATFINGRFVSGAVPFPEFQRAIDAALAAGGGAGAQGARPAQQGARPAAAAH